MSGVVCRGSCAQSNSIHYYLSLTGGSKTLMGEKERIWRADKGERESGRGIYEYVAMGAYWWVSG